jgi:hypothetical protein
MRGYLTVETPGEFQKWMDDQEAQLAQTSEESIWQ